MAHAASHDRKYRLSAAEFVLIAGWIAALVLLVALVAAGAVQMVRQRAAAAQFQEKLADERMLLQAAEVKAAQAAAAQARLRAAQAEKSAYRTKPAESITE